MRSRWGWRLASDAARAALVPLLLALGLGAAAPGAGATTVYHTEEEALRVAFPTATSFEAQPRPLSEELRDRVSERVGYPIRERLVVIHEASADGALLGRAIVLDEIGKTMPFRFLVAFRPDGAVDQVLLLTYREPRGSEIEREAFRAQYRGKTLADPIRRGDDIRNISGATISVDSLSRGVRRALALEEALVPPAVATKPANPANPPAPQ